MLSFMISSPAYLKPPHQIRVLHLHKAMSPNKKYPKIPRRNSKRKLQDMVKSKKMTRTKL